MTFYQLRMAYLLKQDFHGTLKMWKEHPEQLDQEIRDQLKMTSSYIQNLKAKGVPLQERIEYVQNILAPTDVHGAQPPDESLFSQVMDWAFKRDCKYMEEQKRQK